MRRLAFIASSFVLAFAVVAGCRGSVDREFVDDQPITTAEAGHRDAGADADAADTETTDGGGEGGAIKDKDASTDSGPPPKTAAAAITVTVAQGLFGTGLVLQDNGADDMAVPSAGSYTFLTPIPPGQPYNVTVANQPIGPSQTCTVLNGSGTAAGEDVKDVQVNCATATYAVGGSVVGLSAGQSVTLVNNTANDVVVNADGTFTFPALSSGAPFKVEVKTSTPGTTCVVSGGEGKVGTAAIDSVVVNCGTNTYTVGGTVTGLVGTLVVQNNGGNDRSITTNGGFAFSTPIKSGAMYAVTVKSNPNYFPPQQPQAQTCTVSPGTGSGTVGAANVTTVNITCVTNKYTVGGTITGLTGTGLKLQNKGTDDKTIAPSAAGFTFATSVPSGSTYGVTVVTQPSGQKCNVTNGSGTVGKANVSNVAVACGAVNALEQNFDSVAIGALPDGWTTVALFKGTPEDNAWTVQLDGGTSKHAYIVDSTFERDVALVTPAFLVSSATAKLSFSHNFDTEPDWDGGMLEINIAGAGWKDILAAGGSFVRGGYNTTLNNDGTSTVGDRQAWSDEDTDLSTVVNLPAAASGQTIQLRWRFGSDIGDGADGWTIDDIVVTN